MTTKTESLYRENDALNIQLYCLKFKDFLEEHYGYKHGSIRKFTDDLHLKPTRVYRQLSGYDPLTKELRAICDRCMNEGRVC